MRSLIWKIWLVTLVWNSSLRDCDYVCIFRSAQLHFWCACCRDVGMSSPVTCVCEGTKRTMPYCVCLFLFCKKSDQCLQQLPSLLSRSALSNSYLMIKSFWLIKGSTSLTIQIQHVGRFHEFSPSIFHTGVFNIFLRFYAKFCASEICQLRVSKIRGSLFLGEVWLT